MDISNVGYSCLLLLIPLLETIWRKEVSWSHLDRDIELLLVEQIDLNITMGPRCRTTRVH